MKRTLFALCMFAMCFSGGGQTGTVTTTNAPRYQLFAAEIETVGNQAVTPAKRVFRIDTWTGKTWTFESVATTNALIRGEFWHEVPDAEELLLKQAKKRLAE